MSTPDRNQARIPYLKSFSCQKPIGSTRPTFKTVHRLAWPIEFETETLQAHYLNLRKTLREWDKPVFGICMGHQVIGMAAGLDAYRMTFGNRGHNQPVLALASSGSIKAGRVYVTR